MSCLFRALSAHTWNVDTEELRQKICDYLVRDPSISGAPASFWVWADKSRGNEDYTETIAKRYLDRYVNEMRRSSTWGGAIEIISFCQMYRARICVYDIRRRNGNNAVYFQPGRDAVREGDTVESWPMYAIQWSGGHYEPVNAGKTISPPPPSTTTTTMTGSTETAATDASASTSATAPTPKATAT